MYDTSGLGDEGYLKNVSRTRFRRLFLLIGARAVVRCRDFSFIEDEGHGGR